MTRWCPGTPRPKSCWGFAASPIPCARRPPRSVCPQRRRFRRTTRRWSTIWQVAACTPITCRWPAITPTDCATCQAYLCDQSCKNDAGRNGVLPAVAEHGAQLLAECRVVRLEADRTQVRQVICQRRSDMLALKAKVVVLAAGALVTPVLLLNSRSGDWPRGLANGSDWVGRNLMRHLLDRVEVWPQPDHKATAANKEIGFNDFYFWEGQKYGTVQSFGEIPPMEWLTNRPGWGPKALRLMSPAVRRIYERFFTGGLLLTTIMEDLPYLDNRVLPYDRPSVDGRQRLRIQYRLHASEIERHAVFSSQVKEVLDPFRKMTLGGGKDNAALGHVCGTCRFGTDPKTSVLDPQNRAHEVDNLYVVDTSFFPSSAGLNPSLTVAANALRVAAHVNQAHFADLIDRSPPPMCRRGTPLVIRIPTTRTDSRSGRLAERKAHRAVDRIDDAHVLDRVFRRRLQPVPAQHRRGEPRHRQRSSRRRWRWRGSNTHTATSTRSSLPSSP